MAATVMISETQSDLQTVAEGSQYRLSGVTDRSLQMYTNFSIQVVEFGVGAWPTG